MKKTLRFLLEIEIEVDGKRPDDSILSEMVMASLYENIPSVLFDDEGLDCAVFVNSTQYEVMH